MVIDQLTNDRYDHVPMGPGNRRKGPSRLWGLQAIAYTEQLKISMPKWLLDKDQVGTVVGGEFLGVGSWGDPWESWNRLISAWIHQLD